MSLQTDIRESLKTAMREKDQTSLDTLRAMMSAVTNELVATGKTPQDEADDALVQKVITKLVKQRKDSINQFEAGGRADLANVEKAQLAVLEAYLPSQMSEVDIRAIAEQKIAELGGSVAKSDMGKLTGAVIKETVGRADGMVVKKIIEELLG